MLIPNYILAGVGWAGVEVWVRQDGALRIPILAWLEGGLEPPTTGSDLCEPKALGQLQNPVKPFSEE